MSTPHSGNMMDAGASAALKHTDLADGIHEDVSSDLAREHGKQGSILDNLGRSTGGMSAMGADAKARLDSGPVGADGQARYNNAAAGASSATNATDFSDGIYEDRSRTTAKSQSITDTLANKGSETMSSVRDQLNTAGSSKTDSESFFAPSGSNSRSGPIGTSHNGDSMIDKIKENLGGLIGKDSASMQAKGSLGGDRASVNEHGNVTRNTAGASGTL